MADNYHALSPHNYVANNPIMLIEPDEARITAADGVDYKWSSGKDIQ